jgi:hypothetical protein
MVESEECSILEASMHRADSIDAAGDSRARTRCVWTAALLALLAFSGNAAQKQAASCCFTNPRYEGICTVQPTGQETCETILAYLNNPNSAGKSYCGGTAIRGGWKTVKCPSAEDRK